VTNVSASDAPFTRRRERALAAMRCRRTSKPGVADSLAARLTYLRSAASPSIFRDRSTIVTFPAPTNQHNLLDCCTASLYGRMFSINTLRATHRRPLRRRSAKFDRSLHETTYPDAEHSSLSRLRQFQSRVQTVVAKQDGQWQRAPPQLHASASHATRATLSDIPEK
jgi:hypothetical protein